MKTIMTALHLTNDDIHIKQIENFLTSYGFKDIDSQIENKQITLHFTHTDTELDARTQCALNFLHQATRELHVSKGQPSTYHLIFKSNHVSLSLAKISELSKDFQCMYEIYLSLHKLLKAAYGVNYSIEWQASNYLASQGPQYSETMIVVIPATINEKVESLFKETLRMMPRQTQNKIFFSPVYKIESLYEIELSKDKKYFTSEAMKRFLEQSKQLLTQLQSKSSVSLRQPSANSIDSEIDQNGNFERSAPNRQTLLHKDSTAYVANMLCLSLSNPAVAPPCVTAQPTSGKSSLDLTEWTRELIAPGTKCDETSPPFILKM